MKTHIHQPIIVFVDDPDSLSFYMVSNPGGIDIPDYWKIRYALRKGVRERVEYWVNLWLYTEDEMNEMLENWKNDRA